MDNKKVKKCLPILGPDNSISRPSRDNNGVLEVLKKGKKKVSTSDSIGIAREIGERAMFNERSQVQLQRSRDNHKNTDEEPDITYVRRWVCSLRRKKFR